MCNVGEERMQQIRYDQAHEATFSGSQAPSIDIGEIVQLLGSLEDALARGLSNIGLVAEAFRNRHQGDTEVRSDVFHSDWHIHV